MRSPRASPATSAAAPATPRSAGRSGERPSAWKDKGWVFPPLPNPPPRGGRERWVLTTLPDPPPRPRGPHEIAAAGGGFRGVGRGRERRGEHSLVRGAGASQRGRASSAG